MHKDSTKDAANFVSTVFDKAKDNIQKYWYKLEDGTHKQLASANFKIGVADETKKIEIGGKVVGYHSAATVVLDKLADNADADNLYTLKDGEDGKEAEDWVAVAWAEAIKDIDAAIAAVYGENNAPLVYVNGYGYYEVPIRHFNDIEVRIGSSHNLFITSGALNSCNRCVNIFNCFCPSYSYPVFSLFTVFTVFQCVEVVSIGIIGKFIKNYSGGTMITYNFSTDFNFFCFIGNTNLESWQMLIAYEFHLLNLYQYF